MKRAAASITFVSATLVALATLFIASSDAACTDAPFMTLEEACLKSSSRDKQNANKLYHLCQDTLRDDCPNNAQVTYFVLMATGKIILRYNDAMSTIDQMLQAPPLKHCKERYGKARELLAKIMGQVPDCNLKAVKKEYNDAHLAVQSCQRKLLSGYQSSPLYAAVSADLDLTMVAFGLGALLVDGK